MDKQKTAFAERNTTLLHNNWSLGTKKAFSP